MGAPARSWDHPRWRYEEELSPAARRSAARAASRSRGDRTPRHETVVERAAQPGLRVVRRPQARVGAILLIVGFLGAALAAPVGINLAVVRTQWQISELRQQQDDAVADRSSLRAEHAALSSTQRVKETADRLGMVTPREVGFIRLGAEAADTAVSGGAMDGDVTAASGETAASADGVLVASTAEGGAAGR
ncbi:MAG: hypothetical protein ACYCX3_09990 [Thermoleophilia bacterium]